MSFVREYVATAKHKENVRKASFLRESTIRRKVQVNGVTYNNTTQAALGSGLSARTVARYAISPKHLNVFYI